MIDVQPVVKRYGATVAVNDVSFKVDEGEILGFLGPNGAGKSTMLKILTCYIVADSGNVSVAGYDVLEDSFGVRENVGYLPESTAVYSDMQVLDYLKWIGKAPSPRAERGNTNEVMYLAITVSASRIHDCRVVTC